MGWDSDSLQAEVSNPGGGKFSAPVQTVSGPIQPPASINWVPGYGKGVKRPGRGFNNSIPSGIEITGRVEQYLYPPLVLHGRRYGEIYLIVV